MLTMQSTENKKFQLAQNSSALACKIRQLRHLFSTYIAMYSYSNTSKSRDFTTELFSIYQTVATM